MFTKNQLEEFEADRFFESLSPSKRDELSKQVALGNVDWAAWIGKIPSKAFMRYMTITVEVWNEWKAVLSDEELKAVYEKDTRQVTNGFGLQSNPSC